MEDIKDLIYEVEHSSGVLANKLTNAILELESEKAKDYIIQYMAVIDFLRDKLIEECTETLSFIEYNHEYSSKAIQEEI